MNLSPSLMCADLGHLAEEIAFLDAAGVNSFHLDIMDGEYVPNFALSWAEVAYLSKLSEVPMEAHLMVNNLLTHIGFAANNGVERVYIHADHQNVVAGIKEAISRHLKVGLALNPETKPEVLEAFNGMFDSILLMRVNPGFAGQRAVSSVDEKLDRLRERFPEISIMVDGAVSIDVCRECLKKGVDGFVLGTSALFGKGRNYRDVIRNIHSLKGTV